MQTKYETEKKEQQIVLLNKDKEIQEADINRQKIIIWSVVGGLLIVVVLAGFIFRERRKSEKLLLNILPAETAKELKRKGKATAKYYESVTVMFTDFKGFTTIAEKLSAEELVSELDFIFKKFDEIISRYNIEKIKTIGDAYMCVSGLPAPNSNHAEEIVKAGIEIQEWMKGQNNKWSLRMGIHSGPVTAGVVGDKKFAYDIWGDTVNTASRMESSGEAGKINISGVTHNLISHISNFNTVFRGKIPAKNKGEIEMYFVEQSNSFPFGKEIQDRHR
jgi:class 3 adenylate cyclase